MQCISTIYLSIYAISVTEPASRNVPHLFGAQVTPIMGRARTF